MVIIINVEGVMALVNVTFVVVMVSVNIVVELAKDKHQKIT